MDGVIAIAAIFVVYLLMMSCAQSRPDAPRKWARFLDGGKER
jgi:hypothetical protein